MVPMKQVKVITGVGTILVVLCAIFLGIFPIIFNSIVSKLLLLSEDSKALEAFISPPVPIYMQFWLFNVTNPDAIHRGATPILQEVGPYTYEEKRLKYGLKWDHKEGTVTYLQNKTYHFVEEMSNGLTEGDHITTINAVMVSVASQIEKLGPVMQLLGMMAFLRFRESLFITRTVGELLFHGYKEPLLAELIKYVDDPTNSNGRFGFFYPIASEVFGSQSDPILKTVWSQLENGMDLFEDHTAGELLFYGYPLPQFDFDFSDLFPDSNLTDGWSGSIYEILEVMNATDIPEWLAENKLGFFYGRNNTNDGTYKVMTGEKNMNNYQYIQEWAGKHTLAFWNSPYCNMINGTDGSQYPPKVTPNDILRVFTSELCRSLYFVYEKELDVHGIHTYRFIPPRDMLEDPKINPDNLCYCYPDEDHCLGAGMLNMAPCTMGIPVIMSTPHFYQGDEKELAKLVGLNPTKEQHETFLDVEPRTGVTMRAAKKIQVNVPLRRYSDLPTFKNVPEVIFPVLWVNESAEIDASSAKDVKKGVSLPFIVVDAICGSLIAIGAILLIVGGIKFCGIRKSHGQEKL
ncbi:lysosome membrane protein 2-like isoform X1 [Panulirus ornatus]|uniref:lysosome membrane protein 2-like isoform X1 n=1 Tax=Panulirus ornatus TaxID=150431 RepID=UPI003A8B2F86